MPDAPAHAPLPARDMVVHKDALATGGALLECDAYEFPCDLERLTKALDLFHRTLERRLGGFSDPVYSCLHEGLLNFAEHAYKFNPDKRVLVHGFLTDKTLYFLIHGRNGGWNPATAQTDLVTSYEPRGRGHGVMAAFADFLAYDVHENACSLWLGFNYRGDEAQRR